MLYVKYISYLLLQQIQMFLLRNAAILWRYFFGFLCCLVLVMVGLLFYKRWYRWMRQRWRFRWNEEGPEVESVVLMPWKEGDRETELGRSGVDGWNHRPEEAKASRNPYTKTSLTPTRKAWMAVRLQGKRLVGASMWRYNSCKPPNG